MICISFPFVLDYLLVEWFSLTQSYDLDRSPTMAGFYIGS